MGSDHRRSDIHSRRADLVDISAKEDKPYGYRTPGSIKSQERWDFAQRYAAREMIRTGGLLLLTSSLGVFYQPEDSIGSIVGIGISLFFTIILFVRVEKAIDNRFSHASE